MGSGIGGLFLSTIALPLSFFRIIMQKQLIIYPIYIKVVQQKQKLKMHYIKKQAKRLYLNKVRD